MEMHYQEQEYVDRRQFVEEHQFFCKWTARFRRLLEMSFKREIHGYDATIFKQGDPVNGLYFIRSGRVRVTMDPQKHFVQYAHMAPFPTENDVFEVECLRPPKKRDTLVPIGHPDPSVLRPKRRGAERAEKQHKTITICSAGEGECFGDFELLNNMSSMMATITCMERTEIYYLDMKNFERLILKKSPSTLDLMRFNIVIKLRTRLLSQQGRQIPIFRHLLFALTEKVEPVTRQLPGILTNRDVPNGSLLDSYQIAAFLEGKAQLLKPSVPGSFYYKILMEERAKERKRMRKVAKFGLRHKKMMAVVRAPRSLNALKVEETVEKPLPSLSIFEKTEVRESENPVDTLNPDSSMVRVEDGSQKEGITLSPSGQRKLKETVKEEFGAGVPAPSVRRPFNDWETSEKRLDDLENKVKTFAKNASLTAFGSRIKTPCLPKLRRFKAQQLDMPRPGGKVMIKSRECQFAKSKFLVKNHEHIRYHMVSREPSIHASDFPVSQSV